MRFLRRIERVIGTLFNKVRSTEIGKSLNIEPPFLRLERSQLLYDWGWPDGRTHDKSCLAISFHHSKEEQGLYQHDEAAKRWLPKIKDTHCNTWRRNFFTTLLFPDSFGLLGGTGLSPSHPLWTVPTSPPWSQPSFVLLLMQDKTKGEFYLQRL